jgi:transcription initiation factor TFIID subunit TAF12
MSNKEAINEVFKNQRYMTPEQLNIAQEFQKTIEAEYALCAREMKKAKKAAASGATSPN